MGLAHVSRGDGAQRAVHVLRAGAANNTSPPLQQGPTMHSHPNHRVLNRAATTDFSEARGSDPMAYSGIRTHQSSGYLGIPDSPSAFNNQQNLRAAKSFADLRSYTPSPAQSTASFPPLGLQSNLARFQDGNHGTSISATPSLAPSTGPIVQHSSESLLVNGLGNMTIGTSIGTGGSPRRLRGVFSWDDTNQTASTAPIGSNRSANMNTYEDSTNRERNQILPSRQPRGPPPAGERGHERGQNFARGRQNGHQTNGSGELRQQNSNVEIIVE